VNLYIQIKQRNIIIQVKKLKKFVQLINYSSTIHCSLSNMAKRCFSYSAPTVQNWHEAFLTLMLLNIT